MTRQADRITDKQRLDWLSRQKVVFCASTSRRKNEYWVLEIRGPEGRSPRQAIDAAIRASRRGKSK